MSSRELPKPSLDEIITWDEHRVYEHFRHPALRLKPEHITILRDQETDGDVLILLTENDLLVPPYNLPGGPAKKIMNEIARLKGKVRNPEPTAAISPSTLEARMKNIERILLELQKEQLQAPSFNLASIIQDMKRDIEDIKKYVRNRSSLDELHGKVASLPKLMLDLYEDMVPRLFFIFPEDGHWCVPSVESLFTKKFRLYFLCEHETIENGITRKQFHLAYHDGYHVVRPREFVAKFGPYIRTIMPCLLLAVRLGGRLLDCVPAFRKASAAESPVFMDHELELCAQTEKFFKTVGDKVKIYTTDAPPSVRKQEKAPGLTERPDLQELQAHLNGLDDVNRLGNLQRVLRREANGGITVRWVCKNHASEWETPNAVQSLHTTIKSSSIDGRVKFDDRIWNLTFERLSSRSLSIFQNLVTRAVFGIPLRKISFISCEKADFEDVEALINVSTIIEILELKWMRNIQIKNIFQKCLQLREFNLTASHIDDKGVKVLANVLKTNMSLQNLNLSQNSIGEEGAYALAEALKINVSLQNLDLESNYFGEKGASAIAEALKVNTHLLNLGLTNNDIGERGASALAEALKRNTGLQNLNLCDNGIEENGASALAKALRTNLSLKNLDLQRNKIGEMGAAALAVTLNMNTNLEVLM